MARGDSSVMCPAARPARLAPRPPRASPDARCSSGASPLTQNVQLPRLAAPICGRPPDQRGTSRFLVLYKTETRLGSRSYPPGKLPHVREHCRPCRSVVPGGFSLFEPPSALGAARHTQTMCLHARSRAAQKRHTRSAKLRKLRRISFQSSCKPVICRAFFRRRCWHRTCSTLEQHRTTGTTN